MEFSPEAKKQYQQVALHTVITFVGQSAMQMVDLLFCRDLGSAASAAIGTASNFIAWFMIVGFGLVSSLEYFVPKSMGEKDEGKARVYFKTGLWVASSISLVSMFGLIGLSHLGAAIGINPAIRDSVIMICTITAPTYFTIFLVPALRVELQARGRPHDSTYAFIFANLLNVLLNWTLVLGHLGFPALGIKGSAWANVLSRVCLLLFMVFQVRRVRAKLPWVQVRASWNAAKEMLWMGMPTSIHLLFELGAFTFVSTLAARFNTAQNAAHSIALSIASLAFMIPLGLSSGAAVTLSRSLGQNNPAQARYFAGLTIKIGLFYAGFSSLSMILFRKQLISFYTIDPETLRVGASLIFVAALFQFGDAMQAILAGCLRGVGETRVQAKANGIGHWLIGIPVGAILGFRFGLEVTGLWIGLCIGLFTVAIQLAYRWRKAAF